MRFARGVDGGGSCAGVNGFGEEVAGGVAFWLAGRVIRPKAVLTSCSDIVAIGGLCDLATLEIVDDGSPVHYCLSINRYKSPAFVVEIGWLSDPSSSSIYVSTSIRVLQISALHHVVLQVIVRAETVIIHSL